MADSGEILQGYPIEEFLRRETARRRSSETVQLYRSCLYGLRDWMARHGPVSAQSLDGWRQSLVRRGLQPRTVNLHLAAANGYLRWCGRPDLLLRHVQAPAAEGPQLTRPEYLRLLRTARRKGWRRLYLLVKLFATTGLPLRFLKLITVETVRAGQSELQLQGQSFAFFCPSGLRSEILEYADEAGLTAGPVFVTGTGCVIDRSHLNRELTALCREAGVPEEKGNPRALVSLYRATRKDIYASMELLLRQAYDQLLEAEQAAVGWEAGA